MKSREETIVQNLISAAKSPPSRILGSAKLGSLVAQLANPQSIRCCNDQRARLSREEALKREESWIWRRSPPPLVLGGCSFPSGYVGRSRSRGIIFFGPVPANPLPVHARISLERLLRGLLHYRVMGGRRCKRRRLSRGSRFFAISRIISAWAERR